MSEIEMVLVAALVGSIASISVSIFLFINDKRALTVAVYATPFAAGALLAAAFLDLLPEALHDGSAEVALFSTLMGIILFFLLERYVRVFHHHHDPKERHSDPAIPLIIIGDTAHNLIDGVAIAAGFIVSPEVGVITTVAIAVHEIPQEIGDFGLLLHKGMKKNKVVLVNVISALATVVSAVFVFQLGRHIELPLDALLGLVGGLFIYIAVSDVIPAIHAHEHQSRATLETAMLLLGVAVVGVLTALLHGFIDSI